MAVDALLGNESGAVLGVITSTAAFLGRAPLLFRFLYLYAPLPPLLPKKHITERKSVTHLFLKRK